MATDKLSIGVSLTIAGTTYDAPGGSVGACSLVLEPWGFSGSVTFAILGDQVEDPLIAAFVKQDLGTVTLTIAGALPTTKVAPAALTLKALVTDKELVETSFARVDEAVLMRHYTVSFADAAQVLWTQHRPLVLEAETSLATVLKAQAADGITLDVTLPAATEQRPHVCLPLGGQRASFYDFLVWTADTLGGVLNYDYATGKLSLATDKPQAGTASKLRATEIGGVTVRLPATRRHAARVLNSYAESPQTVDVAQSKAVTGISRDFVMRTAVPADVDGRKTLEETRLANRGQELEVQFKRFPTVSWWPGLLTELDSAYIGTSVLPHGVSYRVARVTLVARTADDLMERDWATDGRRFDMEMTALWETKADEAPRLPPYEPPTWPLHVEGRVVCEEGDEGDRTYAFEDDADTSMSAYKVRVPLWDCVVKAPFEPIFLPGHIYAPAWRESRVLLALSLHTAEIVQFLEWGAGVQLPMDSQGNQVLFGKNATNQTMLKHDYVDNKPVFTVNRVLQKDTELLQMEEGILVLQTCEEG